LVTGATGFCGRYLCRYLSEQGYSVTGTFHTKKRPSYDFPISWHFLEITDFEQTCGLIRECKPDVIFHLAALSIPTITWKYEKEAFHINAVGTINLLEGVRRFASKARLLFASSVQVYGRSFQKGGVMRETDLVWPVSPYAVSKAVAELACIDYHSRFRTKVIITRAFNHIGVGQSTQLAFSDWCKQIALAERRRKGTLKVGNLDAKREFLHVEDVVRAYALLARKGKIGSIYNISLARTTRLRNYVDYLLKKAKVRLEVQIEHARMRRDDPSATNGSAARLRALGWRPKRSAYVALDEMLEDWRKKIRCCQNLEVLS